MFGIGCLFWFFIRSAEGGQVLARLWRVGRSMFDVGCSSFKITQYSINATCDRLQNNLVLMGKKELEKGGDNVIEIYW
jgi:hypothetical protein